MGDLPEPVLLPPRPSPLPPLLTGAGIATLAALGVGWFLTQPPALPPPGVADRAVTIDPAKMTGFLRPFDPALLDLNNGENWRMVAFSDAERKRLREDVANKRVHLAVFTVWDTEDEDGDRVRVDSGGYSEDLTLRNARRDVFVPTTPGEPVRITAILDGGGGGVTLGAQTALGPIILPPLRVGQYVEAIVP